MGLPWWLSGNVFACSAGDPSLIPGSGRSPGEGNGNLLQYSCLENPMERGAWQATVHGVTKNQTRLSDFTSLHFIHVSMTFSQIIPPSPSPTESKSLFCTSASLLLSRMQDYRYHLSKFHIYVLVYCIGVFLSGLLHSDQLQFHPPH